MEYTHQYINKCTCTICRNTYNAFKLWRPRNILLCISAILFSDNSKSCIFDAPSNAFCSIPVIWLRRKSNFTKFGRRPNKPSDLMRPSSLSLSNLYSKNGKRFFFYFHKIFSHIANANAITIMVMYLGYTHNSVVYSGTSLGISFKPLPEQSTVVRSQWHAAGHSVSIRHSPAYLVRYSSVPGNNIRKVNRVSS